MLEKIISNIVRDEINNIILIIFIFVYILISKVYNVMKKYRRDKVFKIASKDIKIFEKIVEIRNNTNSNHVLLFQLHNGTKFASGIDQLKISLTHFSTNSSLSQIQLPRRLIDSYPISFLPFLSKNLVNNEYFIVNVEDIEDDNLKTIYLANNIKTIVNIRIGCKKYIYGFIQVCYNYFDQESLNKNIEFLLKKTNEIYLLLLS